MIDWQDPKFLTKSKYRRLTFKHGLFSRIRLIWNMFLFMGQARYETYMDSYIERIKKSTGRVVAARDNKILVIDENWPDKEEYIGCVYIVDAEIEDNNPTFH